MKKIYFVLTVVLFLMMLSSCIPKNGGDDLVTIQEIDFNNEVQNVEVPYGTTEENAKLELVQSIKIKDSDEEEHDVGLTWTIDNYNSQQAGQYEATGTFELPEGVFQTEPLTELKVTANVIVLDDVEEKFNLIIKSIPENSGEVTSSQKYLAETEVPLSAIENENWEFAYWEIPDSVVLVIGAKENENITIKMPSEDVTITAVFLFKKTGEKNTFTVGSVNFDMILSTAATFPVGSEDDEIKTVEKPFWIGETQLTYQLWYTVRVWGEANGYTFENIGREGSMGILDEPAPTDNKKHPVTTINWRDSIVWCNALSEMLELQPVYRYEGNIIRNSNNETECVNAVQTDNNGFRLLTEWEWELSARYIGKDEPTEGPNLKDDAIYLNGLWWTPGEYASGAYAPWWVSEETSEVAWYASNSSSSNEVKGKRSNALDLFDMSGNVREWCFDVFNPEHSINSRVLRGGNFQDNALGIRIFLRESNNSSNKYGSYGFRIAKNF